MRENPANAHLFQPFDEGQEYKRGDVVRVDGTERVIIRVTDADVIVANNIHEAYPTTYGKEDFVSRLSADPKNSHLFSALTEEAAQDSNDLEQGEEKAQPIPAPFDTSISPQPGIAAESVPLKYILTIQPDVHTRTNEDIFVVKLVNKLDRYEYKRLESELRQFALRYSRYKHGFISLTDPTNALSKHFGDAIEVNGQRPSEMMVGSEAEPEPRTESSANVLEPPLAKPVVERKLSEMLGIQQAPTEPDKDDFSDIDPVAIRERLQNPTPEDEARLDAMLDAATQLAGENEPQPPRFISKELTRVQHITSNPPSVYLPKNTVAYGVYDTLNERHVKTDDGRYVIFDTEPEAAAHAETLSRETAQREAEEWLYVERSRIAPTEPDAAEPPSTQEPHPSIKMNSLVFDLQNGTVYHEQEDIVLADEDAAKNQVRPDVVPEAAGGVDIRAASDMADAAEPERHDYHISEADEIGAGGQKTKFRQNVAAIRLLKELEESGQLATPEQQSILAKYVGWGGMPQAFDADNQGWQREYAELKEVLSEEEYRFARGSTLNAHYTSTQVIGAIYTGLRQLGYRGGGNVLEPSMGIGNFFGCMPEDMRGGNLYGVELDSVTGRMAKQLYQSANIRIQGFEKTEFPENSMDVVIGNVPFGGYGVADPKYDKHKFMIHDYFIAKSLDTVRPGGIVALITSKGTMDKENTYMRQYLAQRADLLGAIRLPETAFKKNANTEVTTDILFLRKHAEQELTGEKHTFFGLNRISEENPIFVNEYFANHPEMMLGVMKEGNKLYPSDNGTTLADDGRDLDVALHEAMLRLPYDVMTEREDDTELYEDLNPADLSVRDYCYTLIDDEIYQREGSRLVKKDFVGIPAERVKGMIELRDLTRHIIGIQTAGCTDAELAVEQQRLTTLYDRFTAKYGPVNSRGNKLAFRDDADFPLLSALEVIGENEEISKADIFTKRTISAKAEITFCATAQEALSVSLNEKGRLDLPYMMRLTDKSLAEITADLHGQIFRNPQTAIPEDEYSGWETADQYLSGNVREKLETARAAAERDSFYAYNAEELQRAQPEWLNAEDIDVRLGASWIDTDIVKQFLVETLKPSEREAEKLQVSYSRITSTWFVSGKPPITEANVEAFSVYGTDRIRGYAIAESLLNLRTINIYDIHRENGNERRVLNRDDTIAAREKAAQLGEAFKQWVFDDPERRETLVGKYNRLFNSMRLREFDGSHLTFPGMSPTIALEAHQKNAVARIIYSGNHSLIAHEVGAGKTFTLIAAAMEQRRLGLCKKPIFCVPNHLTDQWANEFMRLYPSANILVTSQADFEKHKRKRFVSRIATGDYDGVIIGHSQFEKIPMSQRNREKMIMGEIEEILDAIAEAESDDNKGHGMVKRLEGTRKRLEAKLERLQAEGKKDDLLDFEQLGTDQIYVDESQNYKNLYLYTKMGNMAGIPQTAAQKSSDMYAKSQYINEINGGHGMVYATGTPISNSMTELFTLMRYLMPDRLAQLGLQVFDAWAADFGEVVSAMELAPDGSGYRQKERFSRFFNVPELMTLFREFTDVQTAAMLNLPVPECEFMTEVSPASDELLEYIGELMETAELIRTGQIDPTEANMLTITSNGRMAALDIRLVKPDAPDLPDSKINRAVDNIYTIWDENRDEKLTQLVFSDLSTPTKNGFNVYDDIKGKLMEKGVPEQEIAFIHDAKTDRQKDKLFESVRRGDVRVLIGSTFKMGAGTNVQDKLVALHHLDVPWRPSDVTQREGRILRQGNDNEKVKIFRYITEQSFDSYSWQIIENKQRFISQIMTGEAVPRTMEDIDDKALTYAELKAIATGDPRILRKAEVDAEVMRLETLERQYRFNRYRLEDNMNKTLPEQIAAAEKQVAALEKDIGWRDKNSTDDFKMVVGGATFIERKDAADKLQAVLEALEGDRKLIGSYRGFSLFAYRDSEKVDGVAKPVVKLYLRHDDGLSYPVSDSDSAIGRIARIENRMSKLENNLQHYQKQIVNATEQIEASKVEYGKPFVHAETLMALKVEQQELNLALNLDKDVETVIGEEIEAAPEADAEMEDEDDAEIA